MHKFKFEAPVDHRKSLQQPHKTDHLHLINLLDKCTQILRQDRIWLRNQLKAEDEEVIDILKQFGKPSQLQHLQIKLRKYIHGVKSRQKMDQLNKFKQNMHLTIVQPIDHKKSTNTCVLREKSSNERQSYHQRENPPMVTKYQKMSSAEKYRQNRNKSEERFETNNPQISKSIKNFHQILNKQKFDQQIIEERESENVTSARMGRHENENKNYHHENLMQEIMSKKNKFNDFSERCFNKPTRGQPMKQIQNQSLKAHRDNDKQSNWEFKSNALMSLYNQPLSQMQSNNRNFHHKNEVEYDYQQQNQDQNEKIDRENDDSEHYQDQQESSNSIFHQHFNDQDNMRDSLFKKQEKKSDILKQYQGIPSNFTKAIQKIQTSQKQIKIDNLLQNSQKNTDYFLNASPILPVFTDTSDVYHKQQITSNVKSQNKIHQPYLIMDSYKNFIPSAPKAPQNNENLFTPLQLLNQCRQFLKKRQYSQYSIQKPRDDHVSVITQHLTSNLYNPNTSDSASKECLFTRNNNQEESTPQSLKIQDEHYSYPSIKETERKEVQFIESRAFKDESQEPSHRSNQADSYHYSYFETFANHSKKGKNQIFTEKQKEPEFIQRQKIQTAKNFPLAEKLNIQTNYKHNIEEFIQNLLESNEMTVFIKPIELASYLKSNKNEGIKRALDHWLNLPQDQQICLSDIALSLSQFYEQKTGQSYQKTEQSAKDISLLLDIEQKGYICQADIQSFLFQIKQAEVENLSEVSHELWRIFESADFKNEDKITYWNLFIIKNTQEFENVCRILQEFQFQIQTS